MLGQKDRLLRLFLGDFTWADFLTSECIDGHVVYPPNVLISVSHPARHFEVRLLVSCVCVAVSTSRPFVRPILPSDNSKVMSLNMTQKAKCEVLFIGFQKYMSYPAWWRDEWQYAPTFQSSLLSPSSGSSEHNTWINLKMEAEISPKTLVRL